MLKPFEEFQVSSQGMSSPIYSPEKAACISVT